MVRCGFAMVPEARFCRCSFERTFFPSLLTTRRRKSSSFSTAFTPASGVFAAVAGSKRSKDDRPWEFLLRGWYQG